MSPSTIVHTTRPRRRELLTLASLGAVASLAGRPTVLAAASPDHPKSTLTPDQALEKLRAGNARFAADPDVCTATSPATAPPSPLPRRPGPPIIACADSRVPPELLFGGVGLGELFVARNAGNLADQATIGTVEYGAAVLGSPLIVVLGHTQLRRGRRRLRRAHRERHLPRLDRADDRADPARGDRGQGPARRLRRQHRGRECQAHGAAPDGPASCSTGWPARAGCGSWRRSMIWTRAASRSWSDPRAGRFDLMWRRQAHWEARRWGN